MVSSNALPAEGDQGTRTRIEQYLAAHTTLTLATVGADAMPAAATVFYACDARLSLYFLSEQGTQHGLNLAGNPVVAGAIQSDGQDWREIRGLQVRGEAMLVAGTEAAHATTTYARKYAFIAALLSGAGGPRALVGPLARARFYVLRPRWFRLIDNTVRFGFKEELWLNDGGTA